MIYQQIIQDLVKVMRSDGIFIYPTDTIWGLGCDAFSPVAVQRIYKTKNRSKDKGLILLVDSLDMLHEYVNQIHPKLETLLYYHIRPLTVIYNDPKNLPEYLIADTGTVAIRIAQDEFCKSLIKAWGKPIISTSANFSTDKSPSRFEDISQELLNKVDYVAELPDRSEEAQPSVIIKVDEEGEIAFLRS